MGDGRNIYNDSKSMSSLALPVDCLCYNWAIL